MKRAEAYSEIYRLEFCGGCQNFKPSISLLKF